MKGALAGNRDAYRKAVKRKTKRLLDSGRAADLPLHESCSDPRYKHDRLTVDHIIPIARGFDRYGEQVDIDFMSSPANLRIVPLNFNIKRAHTWDADAESAYDRYHEWLREQGRKPFTRRT